VNALQIRNVAGHTEVNLTMTIGENLVATKEAFDEQAALPGPIALTHDVIVGPEVSYGERQAHDGATLVFRDPQPLKRDIMRLREPKQKRR
jgi:hypothetical protein